MNIYSVLEIRSFDEESRTIEGIATTPRTDRMGDIVESAGGKFSLPIPLLMHHGKGDNKDPVGWVRSAKVDSSGIRVKLQIAKIDFPPSLKEDTDRAWALVSTRPTPLMPGLSIGFRPIKAEPIKGSFGERFLEWDWLELSLVPIPANQDAVLSIKSADAAALAALGRERSVPVRLDNTNPPGVSGQPKTSRGKPMATKTIQEQIRDFENKRAASEARRTEIMTKAADEGRTLEEAETQEYDNLKTEIKAIDDHLVRLKEHEASMVANATRLTTENTNGEEKSSAMRRSEPITVKSAAPKGIGVARMAIAMIRSGNNPMVAADMARKYWPGAPEVELCLKAAVDAGDTTTSGWASQLVPAAQQMQDEFLELLRPETIIGRIPGLRRVPFNISIPIETASGTARWVGENAPKPVTKLTLSSVALTWAKAAAIVVITKELAKFSRPDAEMVVRNSMVKTLTRFFDTSFVSADAAVSGVSPAGILNGISPITPTGATASAFRVDFNNLLNNLTANNVSLSEVVLLMSSTQAVALSLMVTDLGVPLFPTINRGGGTILGFPVVISEAVGTKIIALNASDILLAEDPGVMVDVSDTASVEMSDTPIVGETSPITGAVLKSFWQYNLIGIRVEQFITWKAARTSAVEYISPSAYAPS